MSNLYRKLDEVYDPTDTDKASRVANKALSLMRYALQASQAQESGLRIGRDLSMFLHAEVMELAQAMGLIGWGANAAERYEFVRDLTGASVAEETQP